MTSILKEPSKAPNLAPVLWRMMRALFATFGRPVVGLLLWAALYFGAPAAGIEYRGFAALLGCVICVLCIRGEGVAWRTVLYGCAAYAAVVLLGYWQEIVLNVGYQLVTIEDVFLITRHEKFTAWHGVALLFSFCVFLFGRAAQESACPWPERYTWLNGSFYTDVNLLAAWLRATATRRGEGYLDFGMLRIPASWAAKNFLFTGIIGCGKTTYFKKLMATALGPFRRRGDHRALIYDLKAEFYPFLVALGLSYRTLIINPFDRRCAWWHLAEEIRDVKTARQIAEALVPSEDPKRATRESSFYTGKARGVLAGLMINFQRHSPNQWFLADLALALRERERYEAILGRDSDTATIVKSLEDEETRGNVMATMDEYRWKFELVAALWDHAQKNGNPNFTIRDWLSDNQILLLTQDKTGGETLNPIYQAILRCIAEGMSAQENSTTRRTWLFMDEFPTLGRVPLLPELLNTCRTKGAATVIAFQSIEQLREVYSDHETNNIVDALKCKAIFRSSHENAKWAQDVFGKAEYLVERDGQSSTFSSTGRAASSSSFDSSSFTTSTSRSREERPLFRSDFFLNLPEPSEHAGFNAGVWLDGYAYAGHEPFQEAIRSIPEPTLDAGYLPAPNEWQELKDWDLAES